MYYDVSIVPSLSLCLYLPSAISLSSVVWIAAKGDQRRPGVTPFSLIDTLPLLVASTSFFHLPPLPLPIYVQLYLGCSLKHCPVIIINILIITTSTVYDDDYDDEIHDRDDLYSLPVLPTALSFLLARFPSIEARPALGTVRPIARAATSRLHSANATPEACTAAVVVVHLDSPR
ncbi:hypothetical protein EJ05DRAFT_144537 [Pseudovirgaria hyperparasitica]|uniref:Uncharacterized protein n=1 Tax=Pseudovirgaria hyperparasitica TaxID=470096 RepID=A0A6A6W0E6_9PEZI|nr:uncharacterized protein EJ05DRAFT_144537 [Pseudovirgaria hyperparasitica]KAF2754541.1 hypothetical protein EJ05DRAFT_144537 [Pseudovirgaria hyperparasitica]